jgi:hypothetical protein
VTAQHPPASRPPRGGRLARALAAETVISLLASAAWSYTAVLTMAGPPPALHLTGNLPADYAQAAGTAAGSGPALFAVTAMIYAACFAIAGRQAAPR